MSNSPESMLKARRCGAQCVVRVEGRGTMRESPSFRAFASEALDVGSAESLLVDLSGCEYLDSTFLGCLVALHKGYNHEGVTRVSLFTSPEVRDKILTPTRLDRVLPLAPALPEGGDWAPIPPETLDSKQFARHIMECHRTLAEVGGPSAAAFNSIADRLEQELEKRPN